MNIYEHIHQTYFDSTVAIDPTSFLSPLEKRLTPGDHILDVGCGSGRDLHWFHKRGYSGTGFEYSPGLAHLARGHCGCEIIEGDFTTYDFSTLQVQAMLMVGALVHVEHAVFPTILHHLITALIPGGHALVTLKCGEGILSHADGRMFVLWEDGQLRPIFTRLGLEVVDFRTQISRLRPDDIWLGYVLKKE